MSLEVYETQILNLTNVNSSSGQNNVLRYRLGTPINLRDYEVALASLQFYYSYPNITSAKNNNSLDYIWIDGLTYNVVLPDGLYTIADISGFLHNQMFQNGHYLVDANSEPVYFIELVANTVYYRVTTVCTPVPTALPAGWSNPAAVVLPAVATTPQLVILANNMRTVLGWNAGTYPAVPQATVYSANGATYPQISSVIAFNVNCNTVTTSYFNSSPSTIFTGSPNVGFGELINVAPNNFIWYRCIDSLFPVIEISLVDQDNNPLQLIDPQMAVTLYFKKRRAIV